MGSITPLGLIFIVFLSLVAVYLITLLPDKLRLGAIIALLVVILVAIIVLLGLAG